jgi:hypothetical protein
MVLKKCTIGGLQIHLINCPGFLSENPGQLEIPDSRGIKIRRLP